MGAMGLSAKIAATLAILTGGGVLSHFFYTAIKSPDHMPAIFTRNGPLSARELFYMAILLLSWGGFGFSGAYGLLSWLPMDARAFLASLIAVVLLILLPHIEESAVAYRTYRREHIVHEELERLIRQEETPTADDIERFQMQAIAEKTPAGHAAYLELAELTLLLVRRNEQDFGIIAQESQDEDAQEAEKKA